jgi:homoserine/homoserine lactone efflux protein
MSFVSYFIVIYIFMLSPGPSMALIARNSAKFGIKGTTFFMLGILTSVAILSSLSVLGVAAIIKIYPKGFSVFKIFGSLYLIFIGVKIFISSLKAHQESFEKGAIKASKSAEFIKGLTTDLLNPVSFVGLTSMILNFVKVSDPFGDKIIYLITTLLASTLYLYTYAFLFGNKVSRKFISPRMGIFEMIAGTIICLLGLWFLIQAIAIFN